MKQPRRAKQGERYAESTVKQGEPAGKKGERSHARKHSKYYYSLSLLSTFHPHLPPHVRPRAYAWMCGAGGERRKKSDSALRDARHAFATFGHVGPFAARWPRSSAPRPDPPTGQRGADGAGLPVWQTAIGTTRQPGQGEGRGNSRQPRESLFALSERPPRRKTHV